MPSTQDIMVGQTVIYTLYGIKVAKRVTSRNINDIKRLINMRKPEWSIK